ncbi:MAG: hypothetical protein AVDCRST_MAG72-1527, partial [uncultured Nocardioidaceae bacterium]
DDRGRRTPDVSGASRGHRASQLGAAGLVRTDADGSDVGGRRPDREERRAGRAGRLGPGNVLLDPAPRPLAAAGAGALEKGRRRRARRAAEGVLPARRRQV